MCKALERGSRGSKSVRVLVVAMDALAQWRKDPSQPEGLEMTPPTLLPAMEGRPQEAEAFQKSVPMTSRPWPVFAGYRLHPSEVRAGRWPTQLSMGLPIRLQGVAPLSSWSW